jgi:hypothetical protein
MPRKSAKRVTRRSPPRSPKRSPRKFRMTSSAKTAIMKAHDQIVLVKEMLDMQTSAMDQRRYGEAKPALDAAQRALMMLWAIE